MIETIDTKEGHGDVKLKFTWALCQKCIALMQSNGTMSNPFLRNHASVATTVLFHKLPKISLEGSLSKQNFLSRVHLLREPAVAASSAHLSNHLIASLPLSSLFVFHSIFVVANSSKTIPCNSWENSVWFGFPPQFFPLSTYHHFLCFLSAPVSR